MKYLSFLTAFLFSFTLIAQETTTSIERISDTTFVQKNTTTYDDGRIVTETIPYTIEEFENLIVDQNVSNLIQIDQLAAAQTMKQQDVNQLKRYLVDSLSTDYDSLLSTRLLVALSGNWKLIERNGSSTKTNVAIAAHNTNPGVLRMSNSDGPGGWNIKPVHTQKFLIKNYDVNGTGEDVEMQLTRFSGFTGYLGKTSDNKRLILRR